MAFFFSEYEILVGDLNPSEKYARQLGLILPNIWKTQTMFQ